MPVKIQYTRFLFAFAYFFMLCHAGKCLRKDADLGPSLTETVSRGNFGPNVGRTIEISRLRQQPTQPQQPIQPQRTTIPRRSTYRQ